MFAVDINSKILEFRDIKKKELAQQLPHPHKKKTLHIRKGITDPSLVFIV